MSQHKHKARLARAEAAVNVLAAKHEAALLTERLKRRAEDRWWSGKIQPPRDYETKRGVR
jgi:hypothetical protein